MSFQPILQFIEGIDPEPRLLSNTEISNLNDWFGQWLAKTPPAARQVTLRALINEALPANSCKPFGIADGVPIVYDHKNPQNPLNQVSRNMRFVVVALPDNPPAKTPITDMEAAIEKRTLCLVGSSAPDSPTAFLQCASWHPNALGKNMGLMRFYQRNPEGWVYFGDSFNAFNPASFGRGPYDGHVGGSMIMKELTSPWTHWFDSGNLGDFINSLGSARDQPTPVDPHNVLYDPLFTDPDGSAFSRLGRAEDFEPIVELSVSRWYNTRFISNFINQTTNKPFPHVTTVVKDWVGHTLGSRAINIAASATASDQVQPNSSITGVPTSLFFNSFALQRVLPNVGNPGGGYNIAEGSDYTASVAELGLNLYYSDKEGKLHVAVPNTEGPFPFPIIEPGVEDYQGVITMANWITNAKTPVVIISQKAIAAMLMVDFCNPMYSFRRESLLKYIPESATLKADGKTYDVIDQMMASLAEPAAKDPSSPEAELLTLLNTPDSEYATTFTARVNTYAQKVSDRLTNPNTEQRKAAVQDYMVLAEGRRRLYKGREDAKPDGSGLDEFTLTLPMTMKNVPFTQMKEDGTIEVMPEPALDFFKARIRKRKANALARYANSSGACMAYSRRAAAGGCPAFGRSY